MKALLLGLTALSLTVASCGTDDDPGYNEQVDEACRSSAVMGLAGQYETPAELDALLDVICGPQSNK